MGDSSMIGLLLLGVISIILVLCIVHMSSKVDELCKTVKEISDELKRKKSE